jgi:hypothetical protein
MRLQLGLRFILAGVLLCFILLWGIFYSNPKLKELGNGEKAFNEKIWEGGKIKK